MKIKALKNIRLNTKIVSDINNVGQFDSLLSKQYVDDLNKTQFEVYPTKLLIPVGATSDVVKEYNEDGTPKSFYEYKFECKACTTYKFNIRCDVGTLELHRGDSDVYINWGDGTFTSIFENLSEHLNPYINKNSYQVDDIVFNYNLGNYNSGYYMCIKATDENDTSTDNMMDTAYWINIPKKGWSKSTKYKVNDVVYGNKDKKYYVCIKDIDENDTSSETSTKTFLDVVYWKQRPDIDAVINLIKRDDWVSDGEMVYTVQHDYIPYLDANPSELDKFEGKKFIVSIYGKKYWGFSAYSPYNYQIISRIFEDDLSLATNLTHIGNFMIGSSKLLKLHCPTGLNIRHQIFNTSGTFEWCNNLQYVKGFRYCFQHPRTVANLFMSCKSLESCDFVLPAISINTSGHIKNVFDNCVNLSTDITKLLPDNGFSSRIIDVTCLFRNCSSLGYPTKTVTVDGVKKTVLNEATWKSNVASKLWDDTTKIWKNTSKCFEGCSDEIRAYVPTTWGGTMAVE